MPAPTTPLEPIPSRILEAALALWRQAEGEHFLPISGRSMLPLIREGDQILVSHGLAQAGRGDILVFRQGNQLVAHRMLSRNTADGASQFLTKGDNVLRPDPLVPAAEILGRVLLIRRGGRELSLDTPFWRRLGWLIAIIMLAWNKVYGGLWAVRRRLWGTSSNRITRAASRLFHAPFTLLLKLLQLLFSRWR